MGRLNYELKMRMPSLPDMSFTLNLWDMTEDIAIKVARDIRDGRVQVTLNQETQVEVHF